MSPHKARFKKRAWLNTRGAAYGSALSVDCFDAGNSVTHFPFTITVLYEDPKQEASLDNFERGDRNRFYSKNYWDGRNVTQKAHRALQESHICVWPWLKTVPLGNCACIKTRFRGCSTLCALVLALREVLQHEAEVAQAVFEWSQWQDSGLISGVQLEDWQQPPTPRRAVGQGLQEDKVRTVVSSKCSLYGFPPATAD